MKSPQQSSVTARAKWVPVTLIVAALLLLLRLFVIGVYEVDSRSMVPTLRGGSGEEQNERVLVRYGRGELERFDLVVLRRPGVKVPRVKRVVGLPGETVRLEFGDLIINGEKLPLSAPRPPLVEVFNDTSDQVEEWFQMGGTEVNPWERGEGLWHLAAEEVPSGAAAGTMFFAKRLTAGHISGDPEAGPGGVSAADCVLGCEVRLGEEPAELHFILREQGDTFRAEVKTAQGSLKHVRIVQRWRGGEELELRKSPLYADSEVWHTVRFGNVDDELFFEITPEGGDRLRLTATARNHLDPSDRMAKGETYGHRIGLGGAAGTADFRNIQVWRDFHYTDRGSHGKGEPVRLGPNELFVLGDNSPVSRDGRDWGPISASDVLGRPTHVAYPFSAIRLLGEDVRPLIPSSGP